MLARHREAFGPDAGALDEGGLHRYRQRGEAHAYEPKVIRALHAAIRERARVWTIARTPTSSIAARPWPCATSWSSAPGTPVPLDEVEPVDDHPARAS